MPHHLIFLLAALPNIYWQGQEKLPLSPEQTAELIDSVAHVCQQVGFGFDEIVTPLVNGSQSFAGLDPLSAGSLLRQSPRLERWLTSFDEDSLSFDRWLDMKLLLSQIYYKRTMIEDLRWLERYPNIYVDYCQCLLLHHAAEAFQSCKTFENQIAKMTKIIEKAVDTVIEPEGTSSRLAIDGIANLSNMLKAFANRCNADTSHALRQLMANMLEFSEFCSKHTDQAGIVGVGKDEFERMLYQRHQLTEPIDQLESYALAVVEDLRKRKNQVETETDKPMVGDSTYKPISGEELRSSFNKISQFLSQNGLLDDKSHFEFIEIDLDLERSNIYFVAAPSQADGEAKLVLIKPQTSHPDQNPMSLVPKAAQMEKLYFESIFINSLKANPSSARRLLTNPAALDGWLFYWNDILLNNGYFKKQEQIDVLSNMILVALNSLADVRMHTRQLSFDETVDLISREAGVSRQDAIYQAFGIGLDPGRSIASLIWWRQLKRAKEEAIRIKADGFNLEDFHASVLRCGSIPAGLLKECVSYEIIRR